MEKRGGNRQEPAMVSLPLMPVKIILTMSINFNFHCQRKGGLAANSSPDRPFMTNFYLGFLPHFSQFFSTFFWHLTVLHWGNARTGRRGQPTHPDWVPAALRTVNDFDNSLLHCERNGKWIITGMTAARSNSLIESPAILDLACLV